MNQKNLLAKPSENTRKMSRLNTIVEKMIDPWVY
jgi:hypothetical protein